MDEEDFVCRLMELKMEVVVPRMGPVEISFNEAAARELFRQLSLPRPKS